jgi:hypothetical protein
MVDNQKQETHKHVKIILKLKTYRHFPNCWLAKKITYLQCQLDHIDIVRLDFKQIREVSIKILLPSPFLY